MENNFQPSRTPQNFNLQTAPRANWKIISLIIFVLIVICFAVGFLFFLPQIQKITNFLHPSPAETISLAEKSLSTISNYQENIISGYLGKEITSKILAQIDMPSTDYNISTILPTTITNSTVPDQENSVNNVVVAGGEIMAQDNYDGSYYKISSDSVQGQFVENILSFSAQNTLKWANNLSKEASARIVDDGGIKVIQITVNKIPDFFAKNLNISQDYGTTILEIDNNYLVKKIMVVLSGKSDFSKITTSFLNYNDKNFSKISKPQNINEFGSYIERESVFIRTEPNGLYDKLWNLWEKKYFGCEKCVNKFWDDDNDKLYNIQEFIFDSNPLLADSNSNGTSDYNELMQNQVPSLSNKLNDEYILSMNILAKDPVGEISTGSHKIGNALIRDSFGAIKKEYFFVPLGAKFLEFKFVTSTPVQNDNSYLTIFFDNKLIFSKALTYLPTMPPKGYQEVAKIPISKFSGNSGELGFILNSVGPRADRIFTLDLNSLKFIY